MNERERAAVTYLMPPVYSFWNWSDDGDTCVWRDGKTIAFRTELETVFRRLIGQPLPPLGAILLLLAAARDSWQDGISEMGILTGMLELLSGYQSITAPAADGLWNNDLIVDVFCTLDDVHKLPAEQRHSPQTKAELVALVRDDARQHDRSTTADDVLAALDRRLSATIEVSARGELADPLASIEITVGSATKESLRSLRTSLTCLRCGSLRITSERIGLRSTTGLDELPDPAPLNLTPTEQIWALINSLRTDPEFGGLARLARNLVAAVHLPKPIAEFDEMPLGGISDISNRGSLDRLLLSELVYDDLTLAVRVAMNEALYLRRESPPRHPARQRVVLLDAGLRTWGVPRVFATAIGLALAATSDRHIQTQVFRSTDDGIATVDFTTRPGLVAHLGQLATTAQPSSAVAALIERVDQTVATDAILVTSADTLDDPDFARQLTACELPALHVATVDRSGAFWLLLYVSGQRRKIVREARFALDELLTPSQSGKLLDPSRRHGRPAILSVEPFPLLLAHQLELSRAWLVRDEGALSYTRDGRLLHWVGLRKGGKQIAAGLPTGQLHWAASESSRDDLVRAVVGRLGQNGLCLLLIDLKHGTCLARPLPLERDSPRAITEYQGVIFVVFDDHVEAFDGTSAEKYGRVGTSHLEWGQGRFFRDRRHPQNECFALALHGTSLTLEQLPPSLPPGYEAMTIFDCPGADGPLAVSPGGLISPYNSKDRFLKVFDSPTVTAASATISRDGARVALQVASARKQGGGWLVDVAARKSTPFAGDPREALEADVRKLIHARPVRHRFRSIAVLPSGTLMLSSDKGRKWWASTLVNHDSLHLRPALSDPPDDMVRHFDDTVESPETGNTLRCAIWSDGSAAFLDSRGMLHLRSSDPAIPEASIVLAEGQMAGWLADGRSWGAPYFLPSIESRFKGHEFVEQVLKPFSRCLS